MLDSFNFKKIFMITTSLPFFAHHTNWRIIIRIVRTHPSKLGREKLMCESVIEHGVNGTSLTSIFDGWPPSQHRFRQKRFTVRGTPSVNIDFRSLCNYLRFHLDGSRDPQTRAVGPASRKRPDQCHILKIWSKWSVDSWSDDYNWKDRSYKCRDENN